jgi:hypothetical protein
MAMTNTTPPQTTKGEANNQTAKQLMLFVSALDRKVVPSPQLQAPANMGHLFAAAVLALVPLPLFVCETASFDEAEAVCLERNNFGGQDWEQGDYVPVVTSPRFVCLFFSRLLRDPPPLPHSLSLQPFALLAPLFLLQDMCNSVAAATSPVSLFGSYSPVPCEWRRGPQ